MKIKKGDPCRVRLSNGEVVEAIYESKTLFSRKNHYVAVNGKTCVAWNKNPQPLTMDMIPCVRFVGPACVLVPVGVSV